MILSLLCTQHGFQILKKMKIKVIKECLEADLLVTNVHKNEWSAT